jgi:DNA processing protein
MQQHLSDWLKLQHTPGVGPALSRKLLDHYGTATEICRAKSTDLARLGLAQPSIDYLLTAADAAVAATLTWAEQSGNKLLTLADAAYPALLKTIHNPPPILYVRGNHQLLCEPQLAIVGSRTPTRGGLETAQAFAQHLAQTGLIITSGLATGIDAAAHKGALAAQAPTVAVMATGVDRIYPAGHRKLAESILEKGALVSELPLGTRPRPELFPQRNRIISGLAFGVLVVEAAQRSGSLITAHCAMEQAREVFAIPGSIHNPVARGCHQLLRQGAKLVESAQDILEELAPQLRAQLHLETLEQNRPAQPPAATELDPDYQNLLAVIDYDPLSVDQLAQRSGLPPRSIASMLLILELQGLIRAENGGRYCRNR